jgi:hypothetical protein
MHRRHVVFLGEVEGRNVAAYELLKSADFLIPVVVGAPDGQVQPVPPVEMLPLELIAVILDVSIEVKLARDVVCVRCFEVAVNQESRKSELGTGE